jgi:hypothetical protein
MQVELLGKVPECFDVRDDHFAFVGYLKPDYNAQKCRFPAPVLPGKPDPVFLIYDKTDIPE